MPRVLGRIGVFPLVFQKYFEYLLLQHYLNKDILVISPLIANI